MLAFIISIIILSVLIIVLILAQPSQEEGLGGLSSVENTVSRGSFLGKGKHSLYSFLTWVILIIILLLSLVLLKKVNTPVNVVPDIEEEIILPTAVEEDNSKNQTQP